jgi:hypothetical protein
MTAQDVKGSGIVKLTRTQLVRILPMAALAILFLAPGSALAHERRTVAAGKYDVVVGWDSEPAYMDLKNGAGIRIMNAGTTTPVTGADKTLKLSIRQGANTRDFPLRAVFGQDGYYVADLLPTRDGDYQWIFSGNINGDQVNETFDTADGKFNKVEPQTALQFPLPLGDPAQSTSAIQAAQADAQSARMLAYVGIAIGVLGVLAGIGAWLSRPRVPAATPMSRPASERV